jgi:anti-sigma factor RsiW
VLFAQLSDYLDEQLDDSLCEQLEQHLDGCDWCKAFPDSLEATIMQLRTLPSETLNKADSARIRWDVTSRYPLY